MSPDARDLIEHREADIAANRSKNDDFHIAQVEELRSQFPGRVRRFRSYEDVVAQFAPDLQKFVATALNRQRQMASVNDARRVADRIDEFPAIRSHVRAHWYLVFHCLAHRKGPGRDKLADYRHVVEASYCQAIATADKQLAKVAPQICPGIKVLTFEGVWNL